MFQQVRNLSYCDLQMFLPANMHARGMTLKCYACAHKHMEVFNSRNHMPLASSAE